MRHNMIHRIVKMTFDPEKIADFLSVFQANKGDIRASNGCYHLELWQDTEQSNVLFTYSVWESEEALENYRQSDVFRDTWSQTKAFFIEKPAAWSLRRLHILD